MVDILLRAKVNTDLRLILSVNPLLITIRLESTPFFGMLWVVSTARKAVDLGHYESAWSAMQTSSKILSNKVKRTQYFSRYLQQPVTFESCEQDRVKVSMLVDRRAFIYNLWAYSLLA